MGTYDALTAVEKWQITRLINEGNTNASQIARLVGRSRCTIRNFAMESGLSLQPRFSCKVCSHPSADRIDDLIRRGDGLSQHRCTGCRAQQGPDQVPRDQVSLGAPQGPHLRGLWITGSGASRRGDPCTGAGYDDEPVEWASGWKSPSTRQGLRRTPEGRGLHALSGLHAS